MPNELQSDPSDFIEGESNPSDFVANAVVEFLSSADDEEKGRVYDLENSSGKRVSVLNAATVEEDQETQEDQEDQEYEGDENKFADSYDPSSDPAVPSSTLADEIRKELSGTGKSPTLDACRKTYNSKN